MAQQVITHLLDDLDGSEAESTLVFGFEGKTYEIDLSKKNYDKIRRAVKPYVENARVVRSKRKGKTTARGGSHIGEMRKWAREKGYKVPDRGRLPFEIHEAYEKAHRA